MGSRVVAVSDLSGSENDVQSVNLLASDGTKLIIDLDADERRDLDHDLARYRDAARPARGQRRAPASRTSGRPRRKIETNPTS